MLDYVEKDLENILKEAELIGKKEEILDYEHIETVKESGSALHYRVLTDAEKYDICIKESFEKFWIKYAKKAAEKGANIPWPMYQVRNSVTLMPWIKGARGIREDDLKKGGVVEKVGEQLKLLNEAGIYIVAFYNFMIDSKGDVWYADFDGIHMDWSPSKEAEKKQMDRIRYSKFFKRGQKEKLLSMLSQQ